MAATTFTGQEIYAKQLFQSLTPQLAPLKGFSTDFSQEAKAPGESVSVQLVEADTVADFGPSNNFKRSASTNKKVTVTFGTAKIAGFNVTPYQIANFNPGWWKQKAELNANTMADAILSSVAGLVTTANFTNAPFALAAPDAVTLAEVAKLKAAAVRANINPRRASIYLMPELFTALENLYNTAKSGITHAQAMSELAAACGVAGVYMIPQVAAPTSTTAKVVGWISEPSALAVAARNFRPASDKPYESVREIVDPDTGIGMTMVEYVDGDMGNLNESVTGLFNAAVGVKEALTPITAKKAS